MKHVAILITSFMGFFALASSYPPEFYQQRVRIVERGPAVVALVTSGNRSETLVIGYKKSGYLNQKAGDEIEAILISNCSNLSKRSLIKIGKEWNNNGYVTPGFDKWALDCYLAPPLTSLQIAFSNGHGLWDSNYGKNYDISMAELYAVQPALTGKADYNQVNLDSWKLIIQALSRY